MPRAFTDIADALLAAAVSGTYVNDTAANPHLMFATLHYEEVRLDVDGWFPQMMASGSSYQLISVLHKPTHWVAALRATAADTWEGQILQVWGDPARMPHKHVRIHVPGRVALWPRMTITYDGGPVPSETRTLTFASPYFRHVDVEFDAVADTPQVTSVPTCAHNERPPDLRCETLTFDRVWDRAGVEMRPSTRRSTVPLSTAGADEAWQDAELHAAMRTYWSAYSDAPRWAMWVLFAGTGRSPTLMGSMFDDSGATQRQGVGIFNEAFERNIPASQPQREEHLRRERFFGLVHETGHCFNLHHAWLFYNAELQWPFYATAAQAATFMQYPSQVVHFYQKFRYEFHESELKFLRHGPESFVQMGDARFYKGVDEFGRESDLAGPWALQVELPRRRGVFEFLEPVTLRLTLRNTSQHPQMVDEAVLHNAGHLLILIGRNDRDSLHVWRPFAQHCYLPTPCIVDPGGAVSATFFVGAGLDGWHLAEPGGYTVHAVLHTHDFVVAARPTRLRIAGACRVDDELMAQELFTKDVGRAFAFGASHAIEAPVAALHEVVERLPGRAVARYAALALAEAWKRDQRVLRLSGEERRFERVAAQPEEARRLLELALVHDPEAAASCFGSARYEELRHAYSEWRRHNGEREGAGSPTHRTPSAW
jgi:hypothetical protein